jgi:hypothetical protein
MKPKSLVLWSHELFIEAYPAPVYPHNPHVLYFKAILIQGAAQKRAIVRTAS